MAKKIISKVTTAILVILVGLVFVVLIKNTIALNNNQLSSFFGYSISYVPSESMEPYIDSGDTVLIKKNKFDSVKLNDVIIYYNDSEAKYIIHRVIEINEDENGIYYVTKGDNNLVPDTIHVTDDIYYGKYIKTVNFLNLQSLIKNKNIVFPACILVFIMLFLNQGLTIYKQAIKEKNKKEAEKNLNLRKQKLRQEVLDEIKKEVLDELKHKDD